MVNEIITLLAKGEESTDFLIALAIILLAASALLHYMNIFYFSHAFFTRAKALNTILFSVGITIGGVVFNFSTSAANTLVFRGAAKVNGKMALLFGLTSMNVLFCSLILVSARYAAFIYSKTSITFATSIIIWLALSLSFQIITIITL